MVPDSRLDKEVQAEKDTVGAVCPRTATPTRLPSLTGPEAANVQANSWRFFSPEMEENSLARRKSSVCMLAPRILVWGGQLGSQLPPLHLKPGLPMHILLSSRRNPTQITGHQPDEPSSLEWTKAFPCASRAQSFKVKD